METSLKKSAAASTGALLTSLVVTPLDVAKARLQAQVLPIRSSTSSSSPLRRCGPSQLSHGHLCQIQRNASTYHLERSVLQRPTLSCPACLRSISCARSPTSTTTPAAVQLRGTFHALRHVIHTEGVASLWSGLSPTLAIAVPSTVFYYTLYDYLLEFGKNTMSPTYSYVVPMVAGSSARIAAATIVSPLELIRTRIQAQAFASSNGIFQAISAIVKSQGIHSLFRGLNATLARDVPFSAIYWSSYEILKEEELTNRIISNPLTKTFVSGAISGAIAATITTPFDVIKTLQQIDSGRFSQRSTMKVVQEVLAAEGFQGLMTGWSARLAKITPACAIMISSYEAGKLYFGLSNSCQSAPDH